MERVGSQVRLLWGPRSLFLGLVLAWLSVGGGRYLSQVGGQSAQTEQSENAVGGAAVTGDASAQRVTLHTAEPSTLQETRSLTGTVVPRELLRIAPAVSGLQIMEMRLEAGDRVQLGQVLSILDDRILRAALAQAEASLAQAQAELQRQAVSLSQAQILQRAAGADIARYSTLYQAGAISQEQLGQKQIDAASAQGGVSVVVANLSSARANVASKLAEIARIQAQLAQTVITAPEGGVVAEKFTTIGDTAAVGSPLYSIIENEQLDLELNPSQAQLEGIEVGSPVTIRAAAQSAKGEESPNASIRLSGSVYAIEPTLDANSRQASVKVSLEDVSLEDVLLEAADRSIKPGMFLQADIVLGQRRSVVVPASAVVAQADGSSVVYTLRDLETRNDVSSGMVDANIVQVASRTVQNSSGTGEVGETGETVDILSGLSAGSLVIVEGASYVEAGDTVQVVLSADDSVITPVVPNQLDSPSR